jgi:hypothetical protein
MRICGWVGAFVVAAFGLAGQAGAKKANLTITPDGVTGMCPDGQTACFLVDTEEERNITHIFIDINFCGVDPPFTVTVDGVPVDMLHTQGGPCNHGDDEIDRIAWFPLTGNQDHARVCVTTAGQFPSVSVGAKSQGECVSGPTLGGSCMMCVAPCDPTTDGACCDP